MSDQTLQYRPGLNSVGSYQMSGIPYATASVVVPASGSEPLKISFPYITREVILRVTGAETVKLGFSKNGLLGTNYVQLAYGEAFSATVRVKDIYLVSTTTGSSTIDVFATLTGIRTSNLPSNWSGSVGVG